MNNEKETVIEYLWKFSNHIFRELLCSNLIYIESKNPLGKTASVMN